MDVETVLKRRDRTIMALIAINILAVSALTLIFFAELGSQREIHRLLFKFDVYLLPIIVIIQFTVLMRFLGVLMLIVFEKGGKSISKMDPMNKIGNFTVKEIKELVDEQCEKMGVTSVKRVYLMGSTRSNAMTLDVVMFEPFRFSVVILFENLFHIMDKDELAAIIGHEIGHVKNRDSWYLGLVANPTFMMVFVLLYLIQLHGFFGLHSVTLLVVLVVTALFYLTLRPLVKRMMRYCEYYADYTSAKTNGLITTTNALIKIGQRQDTLIAVQHEVQRRHRLDLKTLLSSDFYKKLNKELVDVVDPDEAIEITRKVVKEFGGEERKVKKKGTGSLGFLKPKIIDWREYDDHIRNYTLDFEELEPLINDLKGDPDARLFKHASTDSFKALFQAHPRIRDRIIFLWDALKDEAKKEMEVPLIDKSDGKAGAKIMEVICPICQKRFDVKKRTDASVDIDCPGCGIPGVLERD